MAMSISARIRNIALAIGFALVAIVGLAAQPASAAAQQPASAAAHQQVDTDASVSTTCWYEYTFYNVNSTVYASAFKDCVYLDVPQPISFSVQAYVGDEWGSYWVTWAKGSGNIITSCPRWTLVRHSITKETIMCP